MLDTDSHGSPDKLSEKLSKPEVECLPSSPSITSKSFNTVWWKLDLWILPVVTMIFFLQFLASLRLSLLDKAGADSSNTSGQREYWECTGRRIAEAAWNVQ